jgi:hypothetical protein
MTECRQGAFEFQGIKGKRVEGKFDGGMVTTEAGALIVREVAERRGIFERLSRCFEDHRDKKAVEHTLCSLIEQRVYGLVCGYEDLNDHDRLRVDPAFQVLVGKVPELGPQLAGRNTLNRLELSSSKIVNGERYKKIACNDEKLRGFFIEEFIRYAKKKKLKELILDCDATDVPLHGKQQGRFFHGYYGHYCYLPLYIFCEDFPLWAELRPSNIDASLGTEAALLRIISILRQRLGRVRIIVRGDSGFCREGIMKFCENQGIEYVLGLAKNERLIAKIKTQLKAAEKSFKRTGAPSRCYRDFQYRTLDSWSCARRVVGKAEHLEKGANPRFVVTSLKRSACDALELYEDWYCKRGEMENCIKEQFQLFAYRMSCNLKRANQLRLWFSTAAYLVLVLVKKYALVGTALASAEMETIRLRLIKIAATVTVTARRVFFSMASGFPLQELFARALHRATA